MSIRAILNPNEKMLFQRWSEPSQYESCSTAGTWSDGVSRSVASAIAADVELLLPNVPVTDKLAVLEFGHQFAQDDGLLDTYYWKYEEDPDQDQKLLQSAYKQALTTIWIANYTKLMENSGRKKLSKWQSTFQLALLEYFFNSMSFTNFPQASHIEQATIKKYGIYDWYFDYSPEKERMKMERFFDLMHCFFLEYNCN